MNANVFLLILFCQAARCVDEALQNEGEQTNSSAFDNPVSPEIQDKTNVSQPLNTATHGDAVVIHSFCELPVVENARINSEKNEQALYSKGESVEVECLAGFHSNHLRQFQLVCMDDGQWDTEVPSCIAVVCRLPEEIENGHRYISSSNISGRVVPFGTRITYSCDSSYKLQGPKDRWCQSTGWSDENPSCQEIACKEFPDVQNGRLDKTSDVYFPGNEVVIQCDFGYKPATNNRAYIICTHRGTWNMTQSQCVVATCSPPPVFENGWFKQEGHERLEKKLVYDFTDKITFVCEPGFSLQGKKTMSCREQGWTDPFPTCTVALCPRPSVPSEGWIINDTNKIEYVSGEKVQYECPSWYKLIGSSERTCTERGWTGTPVECQLIGCPLPPPERPNLSVRMKNSFNDFAKRYIPFYNSIVAECAEGYKTYGRKEAICQQNGKWGFPKCVEISCRKPYQVANGYVEGIQVDRENYYFNHKITHRCFPGYYLVGQSVRYCRERGWTDLLPSCTRDACSKPNIRNGIAVQFENSWPVPKGGRAEVKCDQGYKLIGSSMIECGSNQQWNDTINKCTEIICHKPNFLNGYIVSTKGSWPLRFNNTAYIMCKEGFKRVDDNHIIHCNQEDERWNDLSNSCIAEHYCTGLHHLVNGKVKQETLKVISENPEYEMSNRLPVGFSALYTCNVGFRLIGDSEITCTEQGWSGVLPICQAIGCPKPEIPNGWAHPLQGTWSRRANGLIQVLCNPGYTLGDEWPILQCTQDGQWNDTLNKCSDAISCPAPKAIDNGRIREDLIYYGKHRTRLPVNFHLTYECNPGYKMIGQPEMVCTNLGWSANSPVCQEVVCDTPRNPENGMLLEKGPFLLNSTATFKCFYGFHIHPSEDVLTCTEDGWTGPDLQCKPSYCPSLGQIKNGHFHTVDSPVYDEGVYKWSLDSVLSYTCEEPYKMNGEPHIQCTVYGQWAPDPPICEGVYCTKPDIEFSVPSSGQFRYQPGEKYMVNCLRGYKLNNTNELVCMEDGSWGPTSVSCDEILCGPPRPLLFGRVSPQRPYYRFGDTVKYVCSNPGVHLEGIRIHTCSEQGWAEEMPTCVAKQEKFCGDPPHTVDNWRLQQPASNTSFKIGDSVVVECLPGFKPKGCAWKNRIVCTPYGNWSTEMVNCIEITEELCPRPAAISNGRLIREKNEYAVRDTVTIICNRGYRPVNGSDLVMCLPGGKWEDNFAQCEEVWCADPPLPVNGILENGDLYPNNSWPYHSEVNFICKPGYQLLGHHWIKCLQNGWSATSPTCKEITCIDPGTPEEGWKNVDSFAVGSRVQFSCFSGYQLIGPKERICLKNGQWSDEQPYCYSGKTSCPGLPIPTGGMKSGSYYNENGQVSFACTSGYMFVGTPTRICKNGTWTGNEALCIGRNEFHIPEMINQELQTSLKMLSPTRNVLLRNSPKTNKFNEAIVAAPKHVVVYFILDSTTSIGRTNFKLEKDFVNAVIQKLNISKSGVRIGVITLSSQAVAEFSPTEFHSKHNVLEAVEKITYKEGSTSLQAALEILEDMMKQTQIALQGVAENHVFLLTDGKINSGPNPIGVAKRIKERYETSFTLLVLTGHWRKQILYSIATDKNHIFFFDSFTTLRWLSDQIVKDSIDYSKCGRGLNHQTQPAYLQQLGLAGKNMTLPWPWMVFIVVQGKPVCRGSLINTEWILTSAWCVMPNNRTYSPEDISLNIGLFHENLSVKEIHRHPQYNYCNMNNNAALIRLSEPLSFSPAIRPVCLPLSLQNKTLYQPGEFGYVSSWSQVNSEAKYRLRHISFPIQTQNACKKVLDENETVLNTTFCAGNGADHLTAINSDYGGPLIQYQLNSDGQPIWIQIGIASSPTHHLYNYFTDISKVLKWIRAFVPL